MNAENNPVSKSTISSASVRVFEWISGWREYTDFEHDNDGYITSERVGDGIAMFLWRVDKEPAHLDHMYLGGYTLVRFSDNAH